MRKSWDLRYYTFAQWVEYYGEEKALQYWADNEVADSTVEPLTVHSREHTRPCPWPWSTSRPAKIQRLDGSAGRRAASNTSVCAQPPAKRDAVRANLRTAVEVATAGDHIRDAVQKAAEKCGLANRDSEVECGRFGKLVDVLVDTTQQTGSVCVVYSNTFAECCAHHMNGRWFVGQNIAAFISTRPNLSLPALTLQQPAVSSATCQRKY